MTSPESRSPTGASLRNQKEGEVMKSALAFIVLLSLGCGSIDTSALNSDNSCKDQTQTSSTSGSANDNQCQGTAPAKAQPAPAKPTTEAKPKTTTKTTSTKVKVDVTVEQSQTDSTKDQSSDGSPVAQKWLYMPQQYTQADAVANAPEGYHLPTRSEVTTANDNGEFAWAADRLVPVWTDTAFTDDKYTVQYWYVALGSGSDWHIAATNQMPSVYLLNEAPTN